MGQGWPETTLNVKPLHALMPEMCIVYSEWIVFANRIGENPKASATSGRWLSVLQLFQDLSQRDLKATVP